MFQGTSLAIDAKGRIPIMSKVIKSVAHRRSAGVQDQDAAIHRIGMEHGLRRFNDENRSVNLAPPHFRFIVSRPSVLLQDGPSSKKLSASKSVCCYKCGTYQVVEQISLSLTLFLFLIPDCAVATGSFSSHQH